MTGSIRFTIIHPDVGKFQRQKEMRRVESGVELKDYFKRFDPTHASERKVFETLGYIDAKHLAPWVKAEVLTTTALLDDVCPPSTQFAAFSKITSPKDMVIYPDFNHEELPGCEDRIMQFMMGL